MTVDGEFARDGCIGISLLHVLYAVTKTRAFVCGERDDGLTVQVALLEECEHYLWIGSPPYGATNEHGVVLIDILYRTLERRKFTVLLLLFGKVAQRLVGHAVVLVCDNLELVGTRYFADIVGHNLRVTHLDISHAVVVASMREEHYECLTVLFHCLRLSLFRCRLTDICFTLFCTVASS